MDAVASRGLSFWDAMLWATAKRAGCRLLLSEDGADWADAGWCHTGQPVQLAAGRPCCSRRSAARERLNAEDQLDRRQRHSVQEQQWALFGLDAPGTSRLS
jgi:hypothetical protein